VRDTNVVPYLEDKVSAFDFNGWEFPVWLLPKNWVEAELLGNYGERFQLGPKEFNLPFGQAIMEAQDRVELEG
jgi:hypothetical protein